MSLDPASIAADDRSFIAARLGIHPTQLQSNENDPASAPTLPGPVPHNPKPETDVEASQHNLSKRSVANRNLVSNTLAQLSDVDRIETMSMPELQDAHSGLKTLVEVSAGLLSQPRFMTPEKNFNHAGDLLQLIVFIIDGYRDVIVEEARGRRAKNQIEAEQRTDILVLSEIEFGSSWDDIAHEASAGASRIRGFKRGI